MSEEVLEKKILGYGDFITSCGPGLGEMVKNGGKNTPMGPNNRGEKSYI